MTRDPHRADPGFFGCAALGALVLMLYGRHLDTGYLADDFLFLEWAGQGLAELLRRVTGGVEPRFLRPLPAFLWYLGPTAAGAAAHHAISLAIHALCGILIARIAARRCRSREVGLVGGSLFLAFPLFTEPVIWLAAAPDLWACCFALAALDLGLSASAATPAIFSAAVLFAAGLLSKESILMLPLVPLFLAPWRISRRLCLAFSLVAIAYLGVRLALMGGPGGYTDAEGRSLIDSFDPILFLRNVCLQLPYRLLVPLKRAGDLLLPLAALSTLLALALASTAKIWQRPQALAMAFGAAVVALLPTAPWFSIDVDQESSRMLYFPVAILAVTAAACLPPPTRAARLTVALLLMYWGAITVANGRAWSEAGQEIERTLLLMRRVEERYDPGTTVLIAGHDTWEGAFAWRNGLAFASRVFRLRHDLNWTLGTAAVLPDASGLGKNVFEIGLGADGRALDWTSCQRALREPTVATLATFRWSTDDGVPAEPAERLDSSRFPITRVTPSLSLARKTPVPAVRLRFASCPNESKGKGGPRTTGRLYWREGGHRSTLSRRFNVTDARIFIIPDEDGEVIVRLPAGPALEALELRIETAQPSRLGCLRAVSVLEGAPSCSGEPIP